MQNKKPIIAILENAQISVGLAFKMRMHAAIHLKTPLDWGLIEADALQMIRSASSVMKKLRDNPPKKEGEDEGKTKIDDHIKD